MHSRALTCLAALALPCCYLSGPHSRDQHRTVDAIRQEHRWASEEIGHRLSAEDLTQVRGGDSRAARDGRRRLLRLLDALDRVAWMREATPRGLWASVEEPGDQDELAFRFARAAQLRHDALAEADELAEALATSTAPGALGWSDLRRALAAVQKSEASEEKVTAELQELSTKEPALRSAAARFPALAMTQPRPFVGAAAAWLRVHPRDAAELDRLPRELQADGSRIRAALAEDKPPQPPETVTPVPQEPSADERAAVRERAAAAHAEADAEGDKLPGAKAPPAPGGGGLLQVSGDAQKMLQSRGLPQAFGQRQDGTFALRYQEPRPCKAGSCPTLIDYLFGAGGRLLREETVGPADQPARPPAAAPPPAKAPPPLPGDDDD